MSETESEDLENLAQDEPPFAHAKSVAAQTFVHCQLLHSRSVTALSPPCTCSRCAPCHRHSAQGSGVCVTPQSRQQWKPRSNTCGRSPVGDEEEPPEWE